MKVLEFDTVCNGQFLHLWISKLSVLPLVFLKLTLKLSFQFSWNTQRICEGFVGEKKKLARLFKRYAELTNSHLGVKKVILSKSVRDLVTYLKRNTFPNGFYQGSWISKHERKVQLDKDSNPLSTCVMVLPE